MRDSDERQLAAELAATADDAPEPTRLNTEQLLAAAGRRRRGRSAAMVGAASLAAAVAVGAVVLANSLVNSADDRPNVPASSVAPEPAPLTQLDEDTLQVMSQAAGALGRGQFAGVFTNLRTDACRCSVTVYLTDLAQKDAFLAAMAAQNAQVNNAHVLFEKGARTRTECQNSATATWNDLASRALPFQVFSMSPTIDCTALELGVSDPQAAQAYFDAPTSNLHRDGLALVAVQGAAVEPY